MRSPAVTDREPYDDLDAALRDDELIKLGHVEPPVVVVVAERWDKLTDKAVNFALRLSPDVLTVHVTALDGGEEDEHSIRARWAADVERPAKAAGLKPPRLMLLPSSYRLIHQPLLRLIKHLESEFAGRTITILLPEVVKTTWWQWLLHTHRARRVRDKLLRYGGSRLIVISIPWYLEEPRIDDGIRQTKAT